MAYYYQGDTFYRPAYWHYGLGSNPWMSQAIADAEAEAEAARKKAEAAKKEGEIELRVALCCDGCERRVYRKLKAMEGVARVSCDQEKQKVVVSGDAKPEAVLEMAQKVSRRAEFWDPVNKK